MSPRPRQNWETAFYLFDAIRTATAGAVSKTALRQASLKENDRAAELFLSKLKEAGAMEDDRAVLEVDQAAARSAGLHRLCTMVKITEKKVEPVRWITNAEREKAGVQQLAAGTARMAAAAL